MPFDKVKADRAIMFFEKHLSHTKGQWKGKPFILLPWQKELVSTLFGTVKNNGMRQYTEVYVEIPKKNGKSELAAGIALYCLCADREPGAEVYSAASNKIQASIVFKVAAQMVRQNKYLRRKIFISNSRKYMEIKKTNSEYFVLSKESKTKHGFNISCAVIDEVHVVDRDLIDVLTVGAGDARRQPLVFYITTAGNDKTTKCWELHTYAEQVINGAIIDDSFLPVIYSLDENEDWEKEENWYKANPSLGHIIDIEKVRKAYKKAKGRPAEEIVFRQLRLNQWGLNLARWLDVSKLRKCRADISIENMKGRDCYIGFDLSNTTDITSICLCFPDYDEDIYYLFWRFYIPEENMKVRVKRDKVKYDLWVRQGYIVATKGDVIDYQYIKKDILDFSEKLKIDVKEITFDPYNSSQIMVELGEEGFETVSFRQGFLSMSPASKEFEIKLLKKQLRYAENPVIEWMAGNVIVIIDSAQNIKPCKKKSIERIDGIIAGIISLYRAILNKTTESVYNKRGMRSLNENN